MKDNLYLILKKLLVKNNISINQEELELQLTSHPSYPSLHAITGVLEHFNIPNVAVRLTPSQELLSQLPEQFIAVTKSDNGEAVVFVQQSKSKLKIEGQKGKSKDLSPIDFIKQWNGIIIAIEKDENVFETKDTILSKAIPYVSIFMAIAVMAWFFNESSLFASWHLTLSVIGLIFSVLLIKQDLGMQSSATNKFCNLSDKTSCDAVLQSKGATLFGLFKLSDLSLVTFSSYVFILLSFAFKGLDNLGLIVVLSLASIPIVFYAIYYQAMVIKKWCPLCLGVSGVLLLQVIGVFTFENISEISITVTPLIVTAIALTTIIIIWVAIKPIIKANKTLTAQNVENTKLKRDFNVFNSLLLKGDTLNELKKINNEIVLGNKNAPLELTLVTSPLCFYCKDAHAAITKILKQGNATIKINLRFMVDTAAPEQELYKIVSQLLHTYHTEGQEATLQLLHHLYSPTASIKDWIQQTEIKTNKKFDEVMDAQMKWCIDNKVNFTPAFYVGVYAFPKQYKRDELLYFVEELIENKKNSITNHEARIAS